MIFNSRVSRFGEINSAAESAVSFPSLSKHSVGSSVPSTSMCTPDQKFQSHHYLRRLERCCKVFKKASISSADSEEEDVDFASTDDATFVEMVKEEECIDIHCVLVRPTSSSTKLGLGLVVGGCVVCWGSFSHLGFFVAWGETVAGWSFGALACGVISCGKSKEN